MTFKHDNRPAVAKALRNTIAALQDVARDVEKGDFANDAEGICDIMREIALYADPIFDTVAKTYTDAKPKEYEKIVTWQLDDLLYEVRCAEEGEMEYERERAAEAGRVGRSDYDEHSTLNRAQQGIGRAA